MNKYINCTLHNISKHGRWWTTSTTCTSNTPSNATVPPVQPPIPPVQLIVPPAQPIPVQPIQPAPMPQLNWSHFKAKFTGRPDEDAEVHLLRTNDWMDTYAFQEASKSSIFV